MMLKFLWKIALFAFLAGAGLAGIYFYNPIDSGEKKANDYLLAIKEKHRRLSSIKGKRIIFVGGSSVAFGTDAASFGPNAFNLGLHAGLGISFMLKEVAHFARKGDLIVLSTEYFLDEGDKALLAYLLKQAPEIESIFDFSPKDQMEMNYIVFQKSVHEKIKRIQMTVMEGKEKVKAKDVNNLYNRKGFNASGDYVNHLGKERPWGLFFRYTLKDRPYAEEISVMNQLVDLQQKGVQVIYVFPSFADTEYKKNEKAILSFERQLKEGLKFPVVGSPKDFILPEDDFYDTAYHLTINGRKKRSDTLRKLLKPYLL
jgi:hypothetical protein